MMKPLYLYIPLYATLGALLSVAYFNALALNVRLYLSGRSGWMAMLLHLLRILGALATLVICARQGALQLLSSVAGFELTRRVMLSRAVNAMSTKS